MKKLLILILGLFSVLPPCSGQEAVMGKWDGGADLNAGTNFATKKSTRKFSYSIGDISAWSRYRTDNFMIKMDLQCLSKFAATSTTGSTVNAKDLSAPHIDVDINLDENTTFEEKAGVLMEYRPGTRDMISFDFRQKLNRQEPNKIVVSMQNVVSGDKLDDISSKFYIDAEEGLQKVTDYAAEAKWKHCFEKSGRELLSRIKWGLNRIDKSSVWHRLSADKAYKISEDQEKSLSLEALSENSVDSEMAEQVFRITPLNLKNNLNASVLYSDRDLFDKKNLNLELGADFLLGFDRDKLSAANFVNEVWVDSLRYRENFDFITMDLSPRAELSYSSDKFNFHLQLTPDFYVSKLDSDRNIGGYNFGKVYVLPDVSAEWTPSAMHKLGISYKQGLTRPGYLQICWFQRSGAYANEIQMGNPNLKPGSNGKAALLYTFHAGFFTGTLEGASTMNWDKIEKVLNTVGEYRIYSWINSGHSTDNRIKLTMKADLKNFKAELGGYYNYFIGYNNAGDVTRSSDYGLNGDATLWVKGGWIFNLKGRYQSKIIRTYSSITEYIGCDVKVTKDFKRFSVYLEGRDLFDRDIEIATYSEDKTYVRCEKHTYNRRLFALGASFKF